MDDTMSKMALLQSSLQVPKNRFNSFSNFHYRKCEDIMEAVKPLLVEHGLALTLTDDLVQIGNRYYIKATAMISDAGGQVVCTAYAREPEYKKGMDEPQITGTASSYARKYALAGLLLLDDAEDIDGMDNRDVKASNASPDDDKIWLDEAGDGIKGTTKETFIKVEQAVQEGRIQPHELRAHYKVSKAVMAHFERISQAPS